MSTSNKGDQQSDRIPFEPGQKKKKNPSKKRPIAKKPVSAEAKSKASLKAIPEAVSQRMVKRMSIFSGIPTFCGMSSFFVFYLIVKGGIKVPPFVVVAVSFAFFGLGVLGLTYGILSTSWDEERVGNWLGWSDFKINFSRTFKALRSIGNEKDYGNT